MFAVLNSMVGNMIGERFVALSFGESHGKCIGMVVDGCPAGLALTESDIQLQAGSDKTGSVDHYYTTKRAR